MPSFITQFILMDVISPRPIRFTLTSKWILLIP